MGTRLFRVLVLALTASLLASTRPAAAVGDHLAVAGDEVRGLWVLRTSLTSPERIAAVVRAATEGGYNTLLVQVRSRGDAYYGNAIEPRALELSDQPTAFDPLAHMLERAHAAGLKVHAWININLISSATTATRSTAHVVSRRPGWLMVPRALAPELHRMDPDAPAYVERLSRWTRAQNESVEGLFLSPILEEAQDYTVSVVTALMRAYALDGVHLDYIRYPSAEFDYSASALDAFRSYQAPQIAPAERNRLDQIARTDPTVWALALPGAWAEFRRDRLTALVRRLRASVKAERPGAIFSSAVVPDPVEARDRNLQDWTAWTKDGVLDVVCPMAYAVAPAAFSAQVEAATAAAHGRPVWIGIGAWRLPVVQTAAHVTHARRAGAAGVLLFSYDSLAAAGTPKGSYLAQLRATVISQGR